MWDSHELNEIRGVDAAAYAQLKCSGLFCKRALFEEGYALKRNLTIDGAYSSSPLHWVSPRVQSNIISLYDYVIETVSLSLTHTHTNTHTHTHTHTGWPRVLAEIAEPKI